MKKSKKAVAKKAPAKKAAVKKPAKKAPAKKAVVKKAVKKDAEPKLPTSKKHSLFYCLEVTNNLLKKIQKYYYFSGDAHAKPVLNENITLMETFNEGEGKELLKASCSALKTICDVGYGARDFFLDDMIKANDKYLSA